LWKTVDGYKTKPITLQLQVDWDKRDGKARADILLHLKDFQFFFINDLKTSKEMWDGLCSMFETKQLSQKYSLQNNYSMEMYEEDLVIEHLNNIVK
jgi:hypothetical protein